MLKSNPFGLDLRAARVTWTMWCSSPLRDTATSWVLSAAQRVLTTGAEFTFEVVVAADRTAVPLTADARAVQGMSRGTDGRPP